VDFRVWPIIKVLLSHRLAAQPSPEQFEQPALELLLATTVKPWLEDESPSIVRITILLT
jgi:hypothetical protein